MDRHTLAIISILGSSLDVLGALYLAYDLLGGEHGPLRTLSRGVTYGVIYAAGFGLLLGPVFGIACGVTHGFTLAWEFSRASRGLGSPGVSTDATASALRASSYGMGVAWYLGPLAGVLFAAASTVGQVAAYRVGIRPAMDYSPAPRIRITRRQLLAVFNRTIGYGAAAALLCVYAAHQPGRAVSFGVRLGLAMGVITAISSAVSPLVEWGADRIPEKRMGVFGVTLILVGFALQSVQYWLTLLDVPVG